MKSTSSLVNCKRVKRSTKSKFNTVQISELFDYLIEDDINELDDDDFTLARSKKGKKSKGIQLAKYGMIIQQVACSYRLKFYF
jgi:hypothetical protein